MSTARLDRPRAAVLLAGLVLASCGEKEAPLPPAPISDAVAPADPPSPEPIRPGDRAAATPHFQAAQQALRRAGKEETALHELDAALEADPTHLEARLLRARLRSIEGPTFDPVGALEDLGIARIQRPAEPALIASECTLRFLTGDSPRAAELGRLYLAAKPGEELRGQTAAVQSVLANIALRNGELESARTGFRAALDLTPDRAALWLGFAQVAEESGQHEEARQALDRACSLEPANLPARWARAGLLRRLGETELADHELKVSELLRALNDSTVNLTPEIRAERAARWDELAQLEPVPAFLVQHAQAAMGLRDFAAARRSAERLAEDPRANQETLTMLAVCQAALGDEDALAKTLARIDALVPPPSPAQRQALERDLARARKQNRAP